jgi:predicted secreted protein
VAAGTPRSSVGYTLKRGDGGSPTEVFTALGKVINFNGPGLTGKSIDVSALDNVSGFREKVQGLNDAGQLTVELEFMPDDDQHQKLLGDYVARTLRNWQVLWPDGATVWAFSAYIIKVTPKGALDAAVTASVDLDITGEPTLVTQ